MIYTKEKIEPSERMVLSFAQTVGFVIQLAGWMGETYQKLPRENNAERI
jgi:hypothetical protein